MGLPGILSTTENKRASAAPTSGRYYHPELNALRFLAFLLVFLTHVGPGFGRFYPSMYIVSFAGAFGVPLFFTLSAFLITELLLRERERTETINVRDFLIRRVLRIWPLYFTFLFIGTAYAWIHGYGTPGLLVISYLTLSANWYFAFHGFSAAFLSPLWSISIEEQFYLIWPTCAKLAGSKGLLVVAGLCWFLFLPTLAILGPVDFLRTWPDSFIQFQFFALGALLALAVHRKRVLIPGFLRIGMVLGGLLCFYGSAWYIEGHARGFISFAPGYLATQLGCLLLLLGFYEMREPTGLLQYPFHAIVWLGRISYGLYVFHILAAHMIGQIFTHLGIRASSVSTLLCQNCVVLVTTIILAAFSYRFLEKPFLRYKQRFTVIRSRPD